MTDPPRLLDESDDPFERELLAAGCRDRGSGRALQRTLVTLGAAVIPTGMAGATSAAGTMGTSAAAGSATVSGKLGVAMVAKWLALGATCGVAAVGVVQGVEHASRPTEPTRAAAPAMARQGVAAREQHGRVAPNADVAPNAEVAPHAVDTPNADVAPSARPDSRSLVQRAAPVSAAPARSRLTSSSGAPSEPIPAPGPAVQAEAAPETSSSSVSAATTDGSNHVGAAVFPVPAMDTATTPVRPPPRHDSLPQELALLDAAKSALNQRRAGAALGLLDRYQAEFASGALAPEATVLRVRALLLAGRRDAAVLVGKRFIAAHPERSQARVIRELVGDSSNP